MIDHFSRWPIAIPLPDRSSDTIAKAIQTYLVSEYGPPKRILSDQGKELISKSMNQLCDRWGIKKVNTGGYNSKGNAACERLHRYLNSAMTIRYDKKAPNWDEYLPAILFSYRVSVNDATGQSPYFLQHGRESTLPSDLIFSIDDDVEKGEDDFVSNMASKLKEAFTLARNKQYAQARENIKASRRTSTDLLIQN